MLEIHGQGMEWAKMSKERNTAFYIGFVLFQKETLILYKVLKWHIGIEKGMQMPNTYYSQIPDVRELIFFGVYFTLSSLTEITYLKTHLINKVVDL